MNITLEQLEREFGAIEQRAMNLMPVMQVSGLMALAEVKERFATGIGADGNPWPALAFPRPQGGSKVLSSTGVFAASFTSTFGGDFFVTGSNAVQANLMHRGGTVRPVKKKWLTIPITTDAVYAGSARNMTGLRPIIGQSKQGGVLVDRNGVAHWYLTKEITLPPRPIVGVSARLMHKIKRVVVQYIRTGRL